MKEIKHLSYSSLNTYSCPRSYYLSRLKAAEPVPAWYFIMGTTVHLSIEEQLKIGSLSSDQVDQIFWIEVQKSLAIEPDSSLWLAGGPKGEEIKEERALKLAHQCIERAMDFLEDMDVHQVEPDISGMLPGCSLSIKAFPDLLGEHKKHGPLIVDWKTGSRPKNALQLETYNALLKGRKGGIKWKGFWALLKPGSPLQGARPIEFKKTPQEMGAMYGEVERKVKAGAFPALPGVMCNFCTMKPNCRLKSGPTPRALYYDTPEEDGLVPY